MRRLSSILFADIAGYTSMMQADEDKARKILKKFRDSLHQTVPKYDGKIIQFYGDGCLVLFSSSVQAMQCAVHLQEIFLKPPNIPVRMGLHSGDVVFEDENAYGNSINEASRIESLGIPNAILFSERVHEDIKNHVEFTYESLGYFDFKSLDRPMEVYALTHGNLALPEKDKITGKLKSEKKSISVYQWLLPLVVASLFLLWFNWPFNASIKDDEETRLTKVAVLPFSILGSEEFEYMGEGIMDLLSNKINGIEGMVSVDPQISNAIFERSGKQLAEAVSVPDWRKQNLDYIITGSMVQAGNTFTLLGSLIDKEGNEFASVEESIRHRDSLFPKIDSFFRNMVSEIFLEREIDFNSYVLQSTQDYDALNDFLKAEQARRQGKRDLAHSYYESATKKDSTFALAWLRWSINIGFYDPEMYGPWSERYIKKMLNLYKGDLPPIFQSYVEAHDLATSGKIPQAIEKAKRSLATYGDHVDGMYLLGDLLYHNSFLENKSRKESKSIFERLQGYDDNYLEAEHHLLNLALAAKDTAYLERIIKKYPDNDPHGGLVRLARIVMKGSPSTYLRDSIAEYLQTADGASEFALINEADTFLSALNEQRNTLDIANANIRKNEWNALMLSGKFNEWFEKDTRIFDMDWFVYTYSLYDKSFQPFGKEIIDSMIAGISKSKTYRDSNAWHKAALGIYYVLAGHEHEADLILEKLIELYKTTESQISKSQYNYMIHRMKLIQARMAGDTKAVESELDSLYTNLIHYEGYGVQEIFFGSAKLVEAEFLLEQGRFEEAKRLYQILPEILSPIQLHGPLQFKIAFLDEQLGNAKEAYDRYQYFLRIYQDCDEFYRANVNHARLFVSRYEMDHKRNLQ